MFLRSLVPEDVEEPLTLGHILEAENRVETAVGVQDHVVGDRPAGTVRPVGVAEGIEDEMVEGFLGCLVVERNLFASAWIEHCRAGAHEEGVEQVVGQADPLVEIAHGLVARAAELDFSRFAAGDLGKIGL